MSDTGMGGEPSAAGNMPALGQAVNLNLPALSGASSQIESVTSALTNLKGALRDLGANSYMLTQNVNNMFANITKGAQQTTAALNSMSSAIGGMRAIGPGRGGGVVQAPSGGSDTSWVARAKSSIVDVNSADATIGMGQGVQAFATGTMSKGGM